MQPVRGVKRAFYVFMGALQVIMSLLIFGAVVQEFLSRGSTHYGLGLPFQHPLMQGLHLVLGTVFWSAVLFTGVVWLSRARRGQEPADA